MDLTAFDALSFDCYGTLIDWEPAILVEFRAWAAKSGVSAPDDELLRAFAEAQRNHQRIRPAKPYPRVLQDAFADMGAQWNHGVSPEDRDRFAHSIRGWPPFADSVESLAYLKRHNRLGVLSNVDHESFRHATAKLGEPFDIVTTAEDVSAYKPDRPHFDRTLALFEELGIPKSKTLHLAQSRFHDIRPARAHGLATVWVDRRHERRGRGLAQYAEAQPDFTVTDLAAFVALHEKAVATDRA